MMEVYGFTEEEMKKAIKAFTCSAGYKALKEIVPSKRTGLEYRAVLGSKQIINHWIEKYETSARG